MVEPENFRLENCGIKCQSCPYIINKIIENSVYELCMQYKLGFTISHIWIGGKLWQEDQERALMIKSGRKVKL